MHKNYNLAIRIIRKYISNLGPIESVFPENEFKYKSYSIFFAERLLQAILENPERDPEISMEQFIKKMKDYNCKVDEKIKHIYAIAEVIAEDILDVYISMIIL